MKKAFLFDMDGLLIDSEKMHLDLWIEIFNKHGIKNGEEVVKSVIGVNGAMAKKILEEGTGNADFFKDYAKEKAQMTDDYINNIGIGVKKGAVALLDYLTSRHYPIILVTSTFSNNVDRFLKNTHLDHYFPERICGDSLTLTKPSPEGYLKAVEKYHLNKEECVILEDSKNGILAGNRAGIDVYGVPDLVDISECDCTLFHDLDEVLEVIKKQERNILVTGFEAFDGDPVNPTQEALPLLPDCYLNYNITKLVLPVDTTCFSHIKEIDQYDCVLSLGLAASRKVFTIEQIAINIDDFRIPDNANQTKEHVMIHEDGNDGYFSTLPIDSILSHLKQKNIEMKISYSAGTYICNHLFYELAYHLKNRTYGFIHVPGNIEYEAIKDMVLGVIEVL